MKSTTSSKKIAIVYDWVDKWGGAERILLALRELFPEADFYTSYVDLEKASWAKPFNFKTTFIQRLPAFIRKNRLFSLLFYPYAFESLSFNSYDKVVSVSSCFAKAVVTRPETDHICILLTPTRWLWSQQEAYLQSFWNKVGSIVLRFPINLLKKWDKVSAMRPDKILSISQTVADRTTQIYGRKSEVLYPPVIVEKFEKNLKNIQKPNAPISPAYILVVSRLEPYKKVDLTLQSVSLYNKIHSSQVQLIVVGKGSMERQLKAQADKNTLFISNVTERELFWLYKNAQCLLMPQEEDFGYTAAEAVFCKCPVVSYSKGGVSEIVKGGKTGIFFAEQNPASIVGALESLQKLRYNAEGSIILGSSLFKKRMLELVQN